MKQYNSNSIRLTSFNIKGFHSNKLYFNKLLQKNDIILLQEHWLFNFEKEQLKQHDPDFVVFTRHVDDQDQISPKCRPRGYGGIAMAYRKTLASSITELVDGDHRIQAIEINTVYQQ